MGAREFIWRLVDLSGDIDEDLAELDLILGRLGKPLHVFRRYPFWKPFDVDPTRPPGRSGGTGLNSLHIDCVNMSEPPDYVALYCARPDPLGGGVSLVAPIGPPMDLLSADSRVLLGRTQFADGAGVDLHGVGVDLGTFWVIDPDWSGLRYTGRLLDSVAQPETRAALLELDRLLMAHAEQVPLKRGQALIIDQRRAVHGRFPLGAHQESVHPSERRVLFQAFARQEGDLNG